MQAYSKKMAAALQTFKDGTRARHENLDSWVNNATGFGTDRDKSQYGFISPSRTLTDIELSALYHSDDMAARMIDVIPQEMLREGFNFNTGVPELDVVLDDKFDSIDAADKFVDGIRWGRCYGGAALLIGADDGRDADMPLMPELAADLTYLYVIDRRMLWPLSWYDTPKHPKLGQPKTYLVTTIGGTHFDTSVVHESRLILFRGAPTGTRERMQLFGWDLSYMQRAYDVLRSFNSGWKAVETLLVDGNQAIFKMTGLADMLASGGEELLRARMQVMDLYRSVMRAMVVDADGKEDFTRNAANFANIPDVLDKICLRLAASMQMPAAILMGQSPAGMDATGDSDFRWFYDRIRAEQNTVLKPKIQRLAKIWLRTQAGSKYQPAPDKKIDLKFPNLWTDPPLVQAQRKQALATADSTYVQAQVFSPEEVAMTRGTKDGFERDIVLSDEGHQAREKTVTAAFNPQGATQQTPQVGEDGKPIPPELDEQGNPVPPPQQLDDEGNPLPSGAPGSAITGGAPMGPDGKPLAPSQAGGGMPGVGVGGVAAGPTTKGGAPIGKLALTASDIAIIVTANEARESIGLPPLGNDVGGNLTLPEFKAKHAVAIAASMNAEKGELDDGTNQPHVNTEGAREPKKEELPPELLAHMAASGQPIPPGADGQEGGQEPGQPPGQKKPNPFAKAPQKGAQEQDSGKDKAADKPQPFPSAKGKKNEKLDATFPRVDAMRPFEMHRDDDETGVSGTGHIADGVAFEDGQVAIRWRVNNANNSTTIFPNIAAVEAVHGHGGKTRIKYLDQPRSDDYDPNEARDDHGQWTSGGGSGGGSSASASTTPGTLLSSSGGGTTTAGEHKGQLYGKGAAGKAMGDPFGHPPPSDDPKNYKPDPTSTKGASDHVTAAARVGIPGKEAPPPFVVPRLANLTPQEREVEKRFADAFEKNPQHFIDAYRQQVYGATKKDGTPDEEARKTFGTDNCKSLSPDYAANAENKALYNIAVHQTANMIAKAAFEQHMAEHVAKLPEDQRHVLVTAGGCAAGKGFALQNAPTAEVKGALGKAAAVWDTAGEQNSTELGWVQKHTEAAGGSAHYVFVDADPKTAFDRVVSRAVGDPAKGKPGEGRVVDKLLFAESYAIGAKNFRAFAEKNKDNPRAAVTYINVRTPPPSISDGISHDAKSMTVKEVHEAAKDYIAKNESRLSPAVKAGATASDHIWGAR